MKSSWNIKRSQIGSDFFCEIYKPTSNFSTLKKHCNGNSWWQGSFYLNKNKLEGEFAFLKFPTRHHSRITAKGAKDTMWFLPQKLDERKRVYIDQQIPSVSPLNIYLEQEAWVKPLRSWLCVTLQMTMTDRRSAIGFPCSWWFI